MRSLSAAARQAIFAQNTDQVFLVLLKLSHPSLVDSIRCVNNTQAIYSNGELYVPYNFRFDPPDEKLNSTSNGTLTIENIDRSIMEAIESINDPPTVEISVILASQPDVLEAGPREFTIRNVPFDAKKISGTLSSEDTLDIQIPGDRFSPRDYGGLF